MYDLSTIHTKFQTFHTQTLDDHFAANIKSVRLSTCIDPVDLADSFVWDIGKSCEISQSEYAFLGNAVAGCQEFESLLAELHHIDSEDAAQFQGLQVMIHDVKLVRLAMMGTPWSNAFNSIRRLTNTEKEDITISWLHSAFRVQNQTFHDRVRNIDCDVSASTRTAFPRKFIHQQDYKAWNKGIATIRRFLRGTLPSTLEKVCRLLQVAYAMGSQDPSHPDFRTCFLDDLARWRNIVPDHSIAHFDTIVKAVWGKTFNEADSIALSENGSNNTLIHLQEILSGVISRCPAAGNLNEEDQDDHQPHGKEQFFDAAAHPDYVGEQPALGRIEDPRAYPDVRKLPILEDFSTDTVVQLMMIGAIFGFIFSFLLIFHSFTLPSLLSEHVKRGDINPTNSEERNLLTLQLYLGILTHTHWANSESYYEKPFPPHSHFTTSEEENVQSTPDMTMADTSEPDDP
ncbi:hypothetical protein BDV95DRAFT_484175 [Massariosphaeria phaeospora]|uniref:Uncharacterized protein n=1 Tax=Massariosphaeria phaeospora TaxID=100035 RepID=A0A7C8MGG9_9PLEO|nr:hypothetical protein BDV95DRAFT_484175 [Massariosphaeria phaeospora]